MSSKSSIEWTDATWNPVTGCTKVSPGCDHCYAETFAERWRGVPGHHFEKGFDLVLRPERLSEDRKRNEMKYLSGDKERRAFKRNPAVALIDIPILAAGNHAGTVSHHDLAKAIKDAQTEARDERKDRS